MSDLASFGRAIAAPLAGARRGDAAAFAELVRVIRPLIFRWACVDSGDPDDAEDVTQEVLVRVYRGLHTYREGSSFTTWLFQIVRNVGLDRTRKLGRRRRLWEANGPSSGEGTDDGVEEALLREELSGIVRSFMSSLAQRQRQALDLVDMQGHSPAEAAEMLGLDPATVRTHLHRARRRLRTLILTHLPEVAQEA